MQKELRDFFKKLRDERGLTQTQVAKAGSVDQGGVSRMETEPKYDPSVESFLGAIRGLGMRPSEFFLQFENFSQETRSSSLTAQPIKTTIASREHTVEAGAHGATVSRDLTATVRTLSDALLDAAVTLKAAADGIALTEPHIQIQSTRRPKSHGRTRRAGNR